MNSKSIAFAIAAVTLSFGSLSFAQGFDRQQGDGQQRYEQRDERQSPVRDHGHVQFMSPRGERQEFSYERQDRNDRRYGGNPAVYVQPQPTYVQPGYYGGEQPVYAQPVQVQQGYGQQDYYSQQGVSRDVALAILATGLISQLLVNH